MFDSNIFVALQILGLVAAVIFGWYIKGHMAKHFKARKEPDWPAIRALYPDIESMLKGKPEFNAIVRHCLSGIQDGKSLKREGQHFLISFERDYPGMEIPENVRHRSFPDKDGTVVLGKGGFKIESLENDRFTVELYFNDKPEILSIPYDAIRIFADPSVGLAYARKSAREW